MDIDREFGPIFNDTHFLKPLLHLQQSVENLVAVGPDGENVTLSDICLKPLIQSDACTVQSIWGYWQDSEQRLDEKINNTQLWGLIHRETNYLDHFVSCAG